ncbi:MAG TPA: DinB family protein [Dongiaceae bacterium]|nr:DinB family protein [Dongiaceae bacterium]
MSMRRIVAAPLVPLALVAALLLPAVCFAHDGAAPAGAPDVRGDLLTWIQRGESELAQLADAMPESTYAWRPGEGVRSVGEVFMHVAAANYGVPTFIGVPAPAGFKFETYEQSLTKKADIVKALHDSFAHMEAALKATSDADLNKPAEFFGMKTTVRGAYFLLLSHVHEHLGQSIAYARMNKVVPPWTAKEQAAAAQKKP